jgi:hypothetical protein
VVSTQSTTRYRVQVFFFFFFFEMAAKMYCAARAAAFEPHELSVVGPVANNDA